MRHELESGVGKDKNNLGLGAEGEEQGLRTNVTYDRQTELVATDPAMDADTGQLETGDGQDMDTLGLGAEGKQSRL